jgi:hypothetical protein
VSARFADRRILCSSNHRGSARIGPARKSLRYLGIDVDEIGPLHRPAEERIRRRPIASVLKEQREVLHARECIGVVGPNDTRRPSSARQTSPYRGEQEAATGRLPTQRTYRTRDFRRRIFAARPARPVPSRNIDAGSGTAAAAGARPS